MTKHLHLTPASHQNKERYNCWICTGFFFFLKHRERLWVIHLFFISTYQLFSVVLTCMLVALKNWYASRWFYSAARVENPALKPSAPQFGDKLPSHFRSSHLCASALPFQPRMPFTRVWMLYFPIPSHLLCSELAMQIYCSLNGRYYTF